MCSVSEVPYEAVFRFKTPVAGRIYRSLVPESEEMGRSFASIELVCEDEVSLLVRAEDLSAFRAALNTWLRLISIADEMQEVINP